MRLEVFWLSANQLKRAFVHHGVDKIDPTEPYVMTSLHLGHWAMYPASLNQQYGIQSQVVATGRNRQINANTDHFWYYYGHRKQHQRQEHRQQNGHRNHPEDFSHMRCHHRVPSFLFFGDKRKTALVIGLTAGAQAPWLEPQV